MRNLSVAMAELDRLSYALNLSDNVKEGAATLYRKALTLDLVRGRSIDAFVAASLYAACRLLQVPRPLSLVCDESKRTRKEVSMTYRLLLTELDLKPPIDSPFKYVSVLAHDLEISRPTERRAVTLLEEAKAKKGLIGKDPRGLAAAALYLACELNGERVVQRRVAKRAETTEVTLRNRYRGLKKVLGIV
jgi:transcription initiation factor TFIIB